MKKISLVLFALSCVGTLIHEFTGQATIQFISKPLILVSLSLYYYFSTDRENRSVSFLLGLFFSLAGDVLLMDPSNFVLGLVAFLLAHIMYILAYRQHRHEESTDELRGIQRIRLAFPIILAGTGLVVVLFPVLGALQIPVLIYSAVITTMVLTALFRYGKTSSQSFWLVFMGAILFMISDSILAVNKFLEPVSRSGLYIMITYIAAQYLIVSGIVKHSEEEQARL